MGCGRPCAPLAITRAGTSIVTLCAEEARTEADLRRGLAGRAPLASDEALVLVFPVEDEVCITNAGVDFAIDAAFVDALGDVVAIEREIAARDETTRCHRPTARVVETAASTLASVRVGDRVLP